MIRLIPKLVQLNACEESLMYLQCRQNRTFPDAYADVRAYETEWIEWLCEALDLPRDASAADLEKALVSAAPIAIPQETWFYVGFNIEQLIWAPDEFLRVVDANSSHARWVSLLKALEGKIEPAKKGYAPKNHGAPLITVRKIYAFLEKDDPTLARELNELVVELHDELGKNFGPDYFYTNLECTPECFDAVFHDCVNCSVIFEHEDRCYFSDQMGWRSWRS